MVLDLGAHADAGAPTEPLARRAPRLPGWVQIAAALVLTVNVAVLLLGTAAVGVSWDEPTHVERLRTYQATGWYLPQSQMDGDDPAEGVLGTGVYAPVAALIGHGTAVLLGSEEPGDVAATPEAYAHRHVAVALLGVVALAAAAFTVRLLVGSWRWGLLAAAVLSSLPAWTGHAMFNIKDVPVGAGYTLLTCGAVALASRSFLTSRRRQVVAVAAMSSGLVLAVGTRPGMAVAAGATAVAALALGSWSDVVAGIAAGPGLRRRAAAAAGALGLAYLVLTVAYPALFTRPGLLIGAVLDSGDYPWVGTVLTAGQSMGMPPPPTYLPWWFLAQTPLVVLVLALIGLLAPVLLLARRSSRVDPTDRDLGVGLALVALQALVLPVVAVATSAILYDATRQVLFVQPALAILATVAVWLVARRVSARRARSVLLFVVVVAGIVVPTLTQARLFPYNFAWFNAVTATRPIDGNWMTEYWRVSARELVAHTPEGGFPSCREWNPSVLIASCLTQPQFEPFWSARGAAVPEQPLGPGEYFVAQVNRFGTTVPAGCTAIHEVSRPLFGQDVLMSAVSRCTIPVLPYPRGGIASADGAGVGYFVAGWVDPAADPVRSYRVPATIAFDLPDRLRGSDLRLGIEVRPGEPVADPLTMAVVVNGVPVAEVELAADPARPTVLDVPARAASALEGRVYVEITLRAADAESDGRPRVIASSVSGLTVRAAR